MISVKEVLKKSELFLKEKGVPSARRSAEDVLSLCLNLPRIDLYVSYDRPLQEEELQKVRSFLKRRALREPIQHIEGSVDFFHCKFKVNSSALIPRNETEQLVDKVAKYLENEDLSQKKLLDLCTGSGCIAISLKKKFPDLNVVGADLSKKALQLAIENARLNQVEVQWVESDLFNALEEHYDYIVCNPPYISKQEMETLEPEVVQYEPEMALTSGKTGFEIYERVAEELNDKLKSGGKVWFEMGYNQKEGVKNLFSKKGFQQINFEKDYAAHNRFFSLELE